MLPCVSLFASASYDLRRGNAGTPSVLVVLRGRVQSHPTKRIQAKESDMRAPHTRSLHGEGSGDCAHGVCCLHVTYQFGTLHAIIFMGV